MDAVSRNLMDEDVCAVATSKCACKRPRHDKKQRAAVYSAKHVRLRTQGPQQRLQQPPPQK